MTSFIILNLLIIGAIYLLLKQKNNVENKDSLDMEPINYTSLAENLKTLKEEQIIKIASEKVQEFNRIDEQIIEASRVLNDIEDKLKNNLTDLEREEVTEIQDIVKNTIREVKFQNLKNKANFLNNQQ